MNDRTLAGVGVLVTRPERQSDELKNAVEAAGGQAILFPVIDIVPRAAAAIATDIEARQVPDIIIFVSVNAVRYGLQRIIHYKSQLAAIGPATSRALEAANVAVDILPKGGFDSEHLLATEALTHVSGKKILIVRGSSGREHLALTLLERGANVDYLAVYESKTSVPATSALENLEKAWRNGQVDAVTIMSVASLHSLLEILPAYCIGQLQKTRLVAPSTRVIQTALERIPGLTGILSPGPGALDMTGALIASLQTDSDTDNG